MGTWKEDFPQSEPKSVKASYLAGTAADFETYLCSAIIPSAWLWTINLTARIIVRDYTPAVEGHLGHDTIYAPAPS
ncbi:hypothetical protein, partial [Salmonella sp. SAL4431]|uniref:hypothetical protein n=1 Tax=Salmonella sp. SAL4431 TaxID=3159886 RepID=UPI00397CED78